MGSRHYARLLSPHHLLRCVIFRCVFFTIIAGCGSLAGEAEASVRTWTGTVSTSWSDGGNWGGTAPVAGDDLVFPEAPVRLTSTNDLAAGTLFNSIAIVDEYTISGNAIVLGGGGLHVTTSAGVSPSLSLAVTLSAPQTWSVDYSAPLLRADGAIHLNGQMLTLAVAGRMRIAGIIDGAGGLTKTDIGELTLSGANTYAGQTLINQGYLEVQDAMALGVADGTIANGTIVTGNASVGGTLGLEMVAIGNEAITLGGPGQSGNGALSNGGVSPSSIAGPITLAANARVNLGSTTLTLSGVISGPGQLGLGNPGPLVLANNANTFTGGIDMDALGVTSATLVVAADLALPPGTQLNVVGSTRFQVAANTQAQVAGLSGAGTIDLTDSTSGVVITGTATNAFTGGIHGAGTITQNGAGDSRFSTLDPLFTGGFIVNAGTMRITSGPTPASAKIFSQGRLVLDTPAILGTVFQSDGYLELDGNATVASTIASPMILNAPGRFDVVGTAPGSLPTLTVHGPIVLGNPTLALQLPSGFAPAIGTLFTIIDTDVHDAITGTFNNLPEGATFATNGVGFRVSYIGGSGNDVTLTVEQTAREYLFSEGATSTFFITEFAFANPHDVAAPVHITFLKDDGTTIALDRSLPAKSHTLIRVNDIAGMEGANFSTVMRSIDGLPLAIERTMSWDGSRYGAHTEHGTDGPSTTWYFAEGSQGFFHTYLLLANPQSTANTATVQYLRENEPPLTRTYPLAPTSRRTIDAGEDAELINRSFGMTVTFDLPGAAERAMYFGTTPLFNGGHESAGETAASDTWYLAEGATGPFFETFVLLANPSDRDTTATLTFLPSAGAPITVTRSIPAQRRVTVNIEQEDPSLANAAVSTRVVADDPILVERSQYWPDPAPSWYEAHNSFGVTTLGSAWAIADGRVGTIDGVTGAQTFILLANPGAAEAHVTVTFLRENGAASVTKTFTVAASTRFNVAVGTGTDVTELTNERFGAVVTSDQPIAVEHALYWDANGQTWAAGTNATGTRLP